MRKHHIVNKYFSVFFIFFLITASFSTLAAAVQPGEWKKLQSPGTDTNPDPEITYNLTGTVLNENGYPVSGVEVSVFSTGSSSTTDEEGKFSFKVSSEKHTVMVSRPGYIEVFQIVDNSNGKKWDQPLLLQASENPAQDVPVKAGATLTSNSIGGHNAVLVIPANSSDFTVNSQGVTHTEISLEYLDLTQPIPVPLPSPETLAPGDVKISGKQAPSVMVAVQPSLMTFNTEATLYLPNPKDLIGVRILRFNPTTHLWVNTGYVTDNTPADKTSLKIKAGGIYGIFYEDKEDKFGSVRGTATPGSYVFVGDEVISIPSDGTFYTNEVPIPANGDSILLASIDTDTKSVVTYILDKSRLSSGTVVKDIDLSHITAVSVTVRADKETLAATGSSTTVIYADVKGENGASVPDGTKVAFSTTAGTLSANGAETKSGTASVTLTAPSVKGEAVVTAKSGSVSGSITITVITAPSKFSISTSQTSVKSDNSDSATITVTAQDRNNAALEGVTIEFKSDGGKISAASDVTDADGKTEITFSSGTVDQSNRTVNIEATVTGLGTRSIPVQVTGTKLTLTEERTNLGKDTLTIAVKNAGEKPVYDKEIKITSVDPYDLSVENKYLSWAVAAEYRRYMITDTSLGNFKTNAVPEDVISKLKENLKDKGCIGEDNFVSILETAVGKDVTLLYKDIFLTYSRYSEKEYYTDVSGILKIEVWGNTIGNAMLKAESSGASDTQAYTVTSMGKEFIISKLERSDGVMLNPKDDVVVLHTDKELKIVVNAVGRNFVKFSTTFGKWKECDAKIYNHVAVVNDEAYATLISDQAGLATVQVIDEEATDVSDSLKVAISAPSIDAAKISLQSSSLVIAISTGDTVNTVTLRAVVKNTTDQIVGAAPVAFSLENTTGGGEFISPVIVYTNNYGVAESTFTSGSLSSGADGVKITATIIEKSSIHDSVSIVIGGSVASVLIGRSSTISAVNNNTAYQMPMSVIVSDANGNPMSGAEVTLGVWATQYAKGYWFETTSGTCEPAVTGISVNEDKNRNLILDDGEDIDGNKSLTPPSSAAGTLPSKVTTDENGVAEFYLVYLKNSASWIEDQITASAMVSGSETRSTYTMWLSWMAGEECSLPNSPYNIENAGPRQMLF